MVSLHSTSIPCNCKQLLGLFLHACIYSCMLSSGKWHEQAEDATSAKTEEP